MTKEELIQSLNEFINSPESFVCEVLFILKTDDVECIKRADIEMEAQQNLRDEFLKTLSEKIVTNEELRLIDISRIDERKNILFRYDFEELPSGFEIINSLRSEEDFEDFSFTNDDLENITAIVFIIQFEENVLISYKKHYPFNLYKRDSKVKGFIKSEHRLVEISDDILKIYPDFDFFYLNDALFIKNIKVLERYLGFQQVLIKKANDAIELLRASDLIEDLIPMVNRIEDLTFMRKLAQVNSHSIVLNDIPREEIIEFATTFPILAGKFKFSENNTQFVLGTKKSQNLFMKLLNDDFLSSQLTKRHYDSSSKDALELTTTS